MSTINSLLNTIFRLYTNGLIQEIPRGSESQFSIPFSKVWFNGPVSSYQSLKTQEKARILHKIQSGILNISDIIYGPRDFSIHFAGTREPNDQDITISAEPLRDTTKSLYDQIDIITGTVIHELGHKKESVPADPQYENDESLMVLYHLVEDIFCDTILSKEFPGFSGYLFKYRRYFYDEKMKVEWKNKKNARINQLILSLRSTYPLVFKKTPVKRAYLYCLYLLSNYREIEDMRRLDRFQIAKNLYSILFDEGLSYHWNEIDYYSERFVLGAEGEPIEGNSGRNQGGNKQLLPPMDSALFEKLRFPKNEFLDQYYTTDQKLKDLKESNQTENVHGNHLEQFLHKKDVQKRGRREIVNQKIKKEIQLIEDHATGTLTGDQQYSYKVKLNIVKSNAYSKEYYQEAYSAIREYANLLKSKLSWYNAEIRINRYGLKNGILHEDDLYQAKFSKGIFREAASIYNKRDEQDIVLIVDSSLSMEDLLDGSQIPKYILARQLSALFIEAFAEIKSIHTWIYTFYQIGSKDVIINEIYSPALSAKKESIGDIYPRGKTSEYEALLAITELINSTGRHGVPKVFILVSDNYPDDDIIPYKIQVAKIKALLKRVEQHGNKVIHFNINKDEYKSIYNHSISIDKEEFREIIHRFGELLKELYTSS